MLMPQGAYSSGPTCTSMDEALRMKSAGAVAAGKKGGVGVGGMGLGLGLGLGWEGPGGRACWLVCWLNAWVY